MFYNRDMKRVRNKIIIQARYIGKHVDGWSADAYGWLLWGSHKTVEAANKEISRARRIYTDYDFRIKPMENKMSRPKTVPLFVLDAVNEFWKEHCYAPSVRDLMEKTGIKSESGIHAHLSTLRELGYVKYDDNIARSVRSVEYDLVISTALNGKALDAYTVELESRFLVAQVG